MRVINISKIDLKITVIPVVHFILPIVHKCFQIFCILSVNVGSIIAVQHKSVQVSLSIQNSCRPSRFIA